MASRSAFRIELNAEKLYTMLEVFAVSVGSFDLLYYFEDDDGLWRLLMWKELEILRI